MNDTAWKVDDKQWMKERRALWKIVKPKTDCMFFLDKQLGDYRLLKEYFLTGKREIYSKFLDANREFSKLEAAPLFEIWLHPDHSSENITEIKNNAETHKLAAFEQRYLRFVMDEYWIDRSYERKGEIKSPHDFKGDGFFDGLDAVFQDWFVPKSIVEDAEYLSCKEGRTEDAAFQEHIEHKAMELLTTLNRLLRANEVNEYSPYYSRLVNFDYFQSVFEFPVEFKHPKHIKRAFQVFKAYRDGTIKHQDIKDRVLNSAMSFLESESVPDNCKTRLEELRLEGEQEYDEEWMKAYLSNFGYV